MWIKKTDQEIQNDKNNFKISYSAPILVLIFTFVVYFGHYVTGSRLSQHTPTPISLLKFLKLLPEIIGVGLILSGLVLLLQKILKKNFIDENSNTTTVICDKCNGKKTDDGNYSCKCGGTFINIMKMKWVEDEEK